MKIIIITDTHITGFDKYNWEPIEELNRRVMTAHPDYIFFLGDLLDSNYAAEGRNLPRVVDFIYTLASTAPVMFVKGNHDMKEAGAPGTPWFTEDPEWLWEELSCHHNFHLLNNEVYEDDEILVGGLYLPPEYYGAPEIGSDRSAGTFEHLAGVCEKFDVVEPNIMELMERAKEHPLTPKPKFMLAHAPKYLGPRDYKRVWDLEFDCCFAGHVHNYFLPNELAWAKTRKWRNANLYVFPPFQTAVSQKWQRFYHHWWTEFIRDDETGVCRLYHHRL